MKAEYVKRCRFCRRKSGLRPIEVGFNTSYVCSQCKGVLSEIMAGDMYGSRHLPYKVRKFENEIDKLKMRLRRLEATADGSKGR